MDAAELARQLGRYAASTIYEAMGKTGDLAPHIQAIVPGKKMAGVAYTVKTPIGQTRGLVLAVDTAPSGSVVVIDVEDTTIATGWGGSASLAAARRGIAGCVTNGSVRDVEQIRKLGVPVFAAGVTVRGGYRSEQAEVQVPVSVGGAAILPGDIIVGDADGVVVVPARFFATILDKVRARHEREEAIDQRIAAGASYGEATGG